LNWVRQAYHFVRVSITSEMFVVLTNIAILFIAVDAVKRSEDSVYFGSNRFSLGDFALRNGTTLLSI